MRRAISIAAWALAALQPHASQAGGAELTPHMIGLILAAEQPCELHLDQPAFGTYVASQLEAGGAEAVAQALAAQQRSAADLAGYTKTQRADLCASIIRIVRTHGFWQMRSKG